MRKEFTFRCLDCGAETTRKRDSGDPLVCFDCGVARSVAYTRRQKAERAARTDVRGRVGRHVFSPDQGK